MHICRLSISLWFQHLSVNLLYWFSTRH